MGVHNNCFFLVFEISVDYRDLVKRSVLSEIVPHGWEMDINEVSQGRKLACLMQ